MRHVKAGPEQGPRQGAPILATSLTEAQARTPEIGSIGENSQAQRAAAAFSAISCGPIRFPMASASA